MKRRRQKYQVGLRIIQSRRFIYRVPILRPYQFYLAWKVALLSVRYTYYQFSLSRETDADCHVLPVCSLELHSPQVIASRAIICCKSRLHVAISFACSIWGPFFEFLYTITCVDFFSNWIFVCYVDFKESDIISSRWNINVSF